MMSSGTNKDPELKLSPANSHIHQHCFPQWYSILMTRGWQIPMLKNTAAPMMIPLKFILLRFTVQR